MSFQLFYVLLTFCNFAIIAEGKYISLQFDLEPLYLFAALGIVAFKLHDYVFSRMKLILFKRYFCDTLCLRNTKESTNFERKIFFNIDERISCLLS